MKTPLRYQITEYDCGPSSLLNGLSYLFEREELAPEIVRNIMIYSLDAYGADGISGKSGTSHAAMMFLSQWLNGFGKTGRLDIHSEYLAGQDVNLGPDSRLRDALARNGAAVVRLDLDGWHYVLVTRIAENRVYLFDSYYLPADEAPPDVRVVSDRPCAYNRVVPISRMEREELHPYAFGPVETREAVLLFNRRTQLTEENTIEYMI